MSNQPGPQLAEVFRRLWAWNVSSWRHGDRIALTRAALSELATMATQYDRIVRPAVPDVGPHALADQLVVLTADALEAGAPQSQVDAVLLDLARGLELR